MCDFRWPLEKGEQARSSEQECEQRQTTGDLWKGQIFGLVHAEAQVGEESNTSLPGALNVSLRRFIFFEIETIKDREKRRVLEKFVLQ